MKKILLAAILLVSALGIHAQEQQNHTIQVNGLSKIDRVVESYMIDFSVASDYGETEGRKSFEDLKKSFFAKAKEAGLNESQFKEDKLAYQALQLFREGSLYTFTTSSRDDLLKAAKLANGSVINITSSRIKFKPVAKDEKSYTAAFQNAKEKAAIIAKSINKKLGSVLTVGDLTPQDSEVDENYYFKPVTDRYVYLSVSFAIE